MFFRFENLGSAFFQNICNYPPSTLSGSVLVVFLVPLGECLPRPVLLPTVPAAVGRCIESSY